MKIHCVRTLAGLVPSTDDDKRKLYSIKIGEEVGVEIRRPRNVRFHRKFFAMLQLVFDNMPDDVAVGAGVACVEDLLEVVKIDLGMFDTYTVNHRMAIKTRSISFARMDEANFEIFYNRAVRLVLEKYLQGATEEMVAEEVDNAIRSTQ